MSSKSANSKIKLLTILDLLQRESDEFHPITTQDILTALEKVDIDCERKSIYADIKALIDFGYDIVKTRTPTTGWFLASRVFEMPEICLLSDAVQSATFISNDKTDTILDKLKTLTSTNLANSVKDRVYVDSNVKCDNTDIYYTIDTLHAAITSKKMVSFTYDKRDIGDNSITHNQKEFTISPYALIWNNDHYYLIGNNYKYDNLMPTRVDRIHSVKILDTDIRPFSEVSEYNEKFNCADYSSKVFGMFTGQLEKVELICDNELIDVMIDRFGKSAQIFKHSSSQFKIVFEAAVSKGLVSWILQHGSSVTIKSPSSLRSIYLNEIKEISAKY